MTCESCKGLKYGKCPNCGSMAVAFTIESDAVKIEFPQPVSWLSLQRPQLAAFIAQLQTKMEELPS